MTMLSKYLNLISYLDNLVLVIEMDRNNDMSMQYLKIVFQTFCIT